MPVAEHPFELPAETAASKDLTFLFHQIKSGGAFHWANDPQYASVYETLARVLYRGRLHHAVLVAERGVDPEAFLTEFARRAAHGWLPFLSERRVILVDARFTAPEESRDRLLAILAAVAHRPELIVVVSGFATLYRSERGANRDALLSALSSVASQLIVLLTPTEYEETLGGDAEAEEFFTRIDLTEPSTETSVGILTDFAATLAERFGVKIADEVVRLAVSLASNYILHERLPSKARKILHGICQNISFDRTQWGRERLEIGPDDVLSAVSAASGVSLETLRGIAEKRDYEGSLKEFIVGQDHAVREVATELGLIKAGLTDANKPASVMLFVGQTGTGKTEMAKALARFYSHTKRLRTYTLGNMVEPHSVSAIIGVPPGYVGHDKGGKIVHDLNSDPHCVFLLDEADKAHPDVLQPFLNLFDEGWIRDQRGAQGFANKAMFILTTNVGQRMIADMAKQGKTPEEMASRMKETLAQIKHGKSNRPVFAPEFLARIKRIIVFQPLTREAMLGICEKLVEQSVAHWREQRGKELQIDPRIIEAIGLHAHHLNEKSDGKEGGRIVRKLISEYIDANLQRAITDRPQEYLQCQRVIIQANNAPQEPTAEAEENNGEAPKNADPKSYTKPDELVMTVTFA